MERRGFWKLKEKALDCTLLRICFGKGYGSVVKADGTMNELVLAIQLVDYQMFLYICMAVVLYIFHSIAAPSVELNVQ
jgi:hypothetical protein